MDTTIDRRAYSLQEVAAMTGLSVQVLRMHAKAEKLRTVQPGGDNGRRLVLAEDLDRYLHGGAA